MKLCTDLPVTCKIRTGWSKSEDEAHLLIPKVLETNVAAVTLHGRSRVCRYTGLARWDYIGQCGKVVSGSLVFDYKIFEVRFQHFDYFRFGVYRK